MDIQAAKTKLIEISKSTGSKHPKILVSELCTIVHFLLDEIDSIKSPTLSVLPKRLPEDVSLEPLHRNPPIGPCDPQPNVLKIPEEEQKRFPTMPEIGNDITAGDAT